MEKEEINKSEGIVHNKKKKKSRIITLLLVILVNLGIVAYIIIRELGTSGGDREKIDIKTINPLFAGLGIALFGLALFAEFMKYRRMLLSIGGRLDRRGAFQVAAYGKYADNITPLGAGGQPFQIHFLHKRGYSGASATSVTMSAFLSQQIAFIIIAVAVLIIAPYTTTIPDSVLAIRIMAYIGLGFYSFFPLIIILFAIFPKAITAMIVGVLKLGHKVHIIKDYESTHEKALQGIQDYVRLLKQVIKKPSLFIPTMFWSFVYQFAILSIPFFAIKAFGGAENWWTIFVVTINIYLAITIIPTPGNSGAAETSFYLVFSALQGGALFWAMIYWRALVYYSWIIIGLIVVLRTAVRNTYMHRKEVPNDRALNICLVCDSFYPTVDQVVQTVDKQARELMKLGHNVLVVAPKIKGASDVETPYKVIKVGKLKSVIVPFESLNPNHVTKLKKYLKSQEFDLIHVHSPMKIGNMMTVYGRRHKTPVFTTFHGTKNDSATKVTKKRFSTFILSKYFLHFYHRVDFVWTCEQNNADTLKKYGFNGPVEIINADDEISKVVDRYVLESKHPE